VSRSVDDGEVIVLGVELLQVDVDGHSTALFRFQIIEDESPGEGRHAQLFGKLLVPLNFPLIDSTAQSEEVAGGGGLACFQSRNNGK